MMMMMTTVTMMTLMRLMMMMKTTTTTAIFSATHLSTSSGDLKRYPPHAIVPYESNCLSTSRELDALVPVCLSCTYGFLVKLER